MYVYIYIYIYIYVYTHTKASFTDIVVYTKSLLSEQTTPVALDIVDTHSTAFGVAFTDKDHAHITYYSMLQYNIVCYAIVCYDML